MSEWWAEELHAKATKLKVGRPLSPGSRACPCRLGRAASFAMAAESPQVPGEPGDKAESDPTTEAERLPEAVEEAAAALRREFEDQLAKGYDYSNESMCARQWSV